MGQCGVSSGYRGTCKGESAGAVPSGQKKEYADKAGADRTVPVCVKGECMHRDWKMRRAAGERARGRHFREEKNTDKESLARFRQKPYALVYAEKLRDLKRKTMGVLVVRVYERRRKNI